MQVNLTPDQQAIVRYAIQSGRLKSEEDAAHEAMALWEHRERARIELVASLNDAEASIERGAGRGITEESMHELVDEVHQRGLARLAAVKPAP